MSLSFSNVEKFKAVIQIENTIISDDIVEKHFVCDLTKCKGACCVEGDAGAPLEEAEAEYLRDHYFEIKPYLSEIGQQEIEVQGAAVLDEDGDLTTPTINNRECVYAIYEQGVLLCGVEKAWKAGVIDFQKPISCHLYPIRISKYDNFEALNYERWNICNQACLNGEKLQVPIYVFLKDALVRKYGEKWYETLELTVKGEM